WYVYRDGSWRPDVHGPWWTQPGLPRIVVDQAGRIVEANHLALSLLGLRPDDLPIAATELVAPGTLLDASALFEIVRSGRALTATVLLRPRGGEVIAVDLRAARERRRLVGVFRLASDVEVEQARDGRAADAEAATEADIERHRLETHPAEDVVFHQYAAELLASLAEPTAERLELALRRLYPRTRVRHVDGDDAWTVTRDPAPEHGTAEWWLDGALPRLRYDMRGLILEANAPARAFLGRDELVGHHWQEFVTPTATDDVGPVLDIIRRTGVAISRFRMPTGEGDLVEFDSYTTADGDTLTTVMRPV
ncbi:MAG TPA: PAS domain-containing protein, partial [Candidatus Limnocylindrales bacterium]|nr:PAS domain-containing protein [Candidatus Limnocylindrales bacterium]